MLPQPMSPSARIWAPPTIGMAAWVVSALTIAPTWTAALLLFSPFVLVPLGLRLASTSETGPDAPPLRLLTTYAPGFAAVAATSFIPNQGTFAGLLSLPWLLFTASIAWFGIARTLSRRSLAEPGIASDAGLLFVVVGGAWFTLSRFGANPLGFGDPIVQLTAVHFHYAGFALPIVAGFTASRLGRSVATPAAVVLGVPLTALGITMGGWLEWLAATVMATAGIGVAASLFALGHQQRGLRRSLIWTAGTALGTGMSLALGWSWSVRFGWGFIGLDSMAATHGSLNALGFGLLGLIGLTLIERPTMYTPHRLGIHLGRPTDAELAELAIAAEGWETTNKPGMINSPAPSGFTAKSWRRDLDTTSIDDASEAIRQWRGHHTARVRLSPAQPHIAVGTSMAIAIGIGPISITGANRIVEVIDEPGRYGFTYATLPHHAEDGEESFIVTQHNDGHIELVIAAVWRRAFLANALCPPLTRYLQNRAINHYLDGIAMHGRKPVKEF